MSCARACASSQVGLALIAAGVVLALDRIGVLDAARVLDVWPLAFIAMGGVLIAQVFRSRP